MTEITIYTSGGSVTYILRDTTEDFADELSDALAGGSVVKAETADGSLLVINPINAAAIEIKPVDEDTPPGS